MKKRFMKPIIFFTLFVVTLFSCNKSSSSVADGTKKGILHFGNQTEPEDLDPHIVTGVPEYHILQALFEGLVSPDPVDLHPIRSRQILGYFRQSSYLYLSSAE